MDLVKIPQEPSASMYSALASGAHYREKVPGTCEKIGFADFSITHFQ